MEHFSNLDSLLFQFLLNIYFVYEFLSDWVKRVFRPIWKPINSSSIYKRREVTNSIPKWISNWRES